MQDPPVVEDDHFTGPQRALKGDVRRMDLAIEGQIGVVPTLGRFGVAGREIEGPVVQPDGPDVAQRAKLDHRRMGGPARARSIGVTEARRRAGQEVERLGVINP